MIGVDPMKADKLRELCRGHKLVRLDRDIQNTDPIHGFLLSMSHRLLLLHNLDDFHLDGYSIIRRGDISDIRYSKFERYLEKMLKAEGVCQQVGLQDQIRLDDWPSVFRSLKHIGHNVIVESEDPDIDEFAIGKIVRISKKSLTMYDFDATGRWYKESWHAPYKDITKVKFDSEYIQIFSKYLCPTRKRK